MKDLRRDQTTERGAAFDVVGKFRGQFGKQVVATKRRLGKDDERGDGGEEARNAPSDEKERA